MKKKVNIISQMLALLFFSLMLVVDFFPDLGIELSVVVAGFIIVIILAVITRSKGEPVFKSKKHELIFTFVLGTYILSLINILGLLGGESQVGLSWTDPVLWLLYLSGVFGSFIRCKKESSTLRQDTFQ